MASLLRMAAKDLRRRARAPVSLVVMLIFPLAFAGMLGLAVGPSSRGNAGLPRIKVLLVDRDEEVLSNLLTGSFDNNQLSDMFEIVRVPTEEEARGIMENGGASAMLLIPEKFTDDLLNHRPVNLILVKNPAESILPQVVEETTKVLAVMLDAGVRVLAEPMQAAKENFKDDGDGDFKLPSDASLTFLTLQFAGKIRPLSHYLFPPLVIYDTVSESDVPLPLAIQARAGEKLSLLKERAAALAQPGPGAEKSGGFNLFAFLLPMVTLVSILFLGENGMRDLMAEAKSGTLTRQFISPAGVFQVLLAKVIFTLALCVASMLLLGVVALPLGWIPAGIDLPGAVVQVLAISLAATGLGALVYGFVASERAASTVHSAIVMGMSFLGGSFMPISQMPAPMRAMAPFTINYWGVQGLQDLTVRQGDLSGILGKAGVLAAVGAITILAGWVRLSRRYAAGKTA